MRMTDAGRASPVRTAQVTHREPPESTTRPKSSRKVALATGEGLWGSKYDSNRRVVRVEFEVFGRAQRLRGSTSPAEVLAAAGALWMLLTSEWLTYRFRTQDPTRSRWPMAPEWRQVQRAYIAHDAVGIERMAAARRRPPLQGSSRVLSGTWPPTPLSLARRVSTIRGGPSGFFCATTPGGVGESSPIGSPRRQRASRAMTGEPDLERVAAVLVRVGCAW